MKRKLCLLLTSALLLLPLCGCIEKAVPGSSSAAEDAGASWRLVEVGDPVPRG